MEDIIKIYEKMKYQDELNKKLLKRTIFINDRLNNSQMSPRSKITTLPNDIYNNAFNESTININDQSMFVPMSDYLSNTLQIGGPIHTNKNFERN